MANEIIGTIGLIVALTTTAVVFYSLGYSKGRQTCEFDKVVWEAEIKAANKGSRMYDLQLEKDYMAKVENLMTWTRKHEAEMQFLKEENAKLKQWRAACEK